MSSSVLILNLVVLFVVLESDLGRRTVGTFRILRPLIMAAGLVPLFVDRPATAGAGAIFEVVLTTVGVLLGLVAATRLMRVGVDAQQHRVVSTAGVGYSLFWCVIIGTRLLFTYGANHWYTAQLNHWMASVAISVNALTDGLMFMAVAMAVTRTLRLAVGRVQAGRCVVSQQLAVRA